MPVCRHRCWRRLSCWGASAFSALQPTRQVFFVLVTSQRNGGKIQMVLSCGDLWRSIRSSAASAATADSFRCLSASFFELLQWQHSSVLLSLVVRLATTAAASIGRSFERAGERADVWSTGRQSCAFLPQSYFFPPISSSHQHPPRFLLLLLPAGSPSQCRQTEIGSDLLGAHLEE